MATKATSLKRKLKPSGVTLREPQEVTVNPKSGNTPGGRAGRGNQWGRDASQQRKQNLLLAFSRCLRLTLHQPKGPEPGPERELERKSLGSWGGGLARP